MSWATGHIAKLKTGQPVTMRVFGRSMTGIIESGSEVTVLPIHRPLKIGDVVLCTVKGADYLHLIKDIAGASYLIGNNKGKTNGWTNKIHGLWDRGG